MSILFDFNSSLSGVSVKRASGGSYFDATGEFQWEPLADTPRVTYNEAGDTWRGLMVEPESTNVADFGNTIDFTAANLGTSSGIGQVTAVNAAAMGLDNEQSATLMSAPAGNSEARWWITLTDEFESEWLAVSQYVKLTANSANTESFGMGTLQDGTHTADEVPVPTDGNWARLVLEGTASFGTAVDATGTIYGYNRRNHPTPNTGPDEWLMWGFQIEFRDARRQTATSLIPRWMPGVGATRAADEVTLAVPNGRYHIRVVGEQSVRNIPDVEIKDSKWVIEQHPRDYIVKSVEFFDVNSDETIGGQTVIKKTIGTNADFETLKEARDAMPANLVTAEEIWWLQVLPGTHVETSTSQFTAVTSENNPIWLSSCFFGKPWFNNPDDWFETRNRTIISKASQQAIEVKTDFMTIWGLTIDGFQVSDSASASGNGNGLNVFTDVRDCLITGTAYQSGTTHSFVRTRNLYVTGAEYLGRINPDSSLRWLNLHMVALSSANKSTVNTNDGISGGTNYFCAAFNYEGNAGMFGRKKYCATDGSTGGVGGLDNVVYGAFFENAYPDPKLAAASPGILSGVRVFTECQFDIRGARRDPDSPAEIGPSSLSNEGAPSYASLVAKAQAGEAQVINRNYPSSVFAYNPMWDGTGGTAAVAFSGGWRSYDAVPKGISNGGFRISGHGGGHGATVMDGGRINFNLSQDLKWERTTAGREIQVIAKDDALGPVSKNTSSPNYPNNLIAVPSDWVTESWVPLDAHYYGGSGSNGALTADGKYMVFIGSSFFSSSGGYAYGNHISILDTDTGYWVEAVSGSNGESWPNNIGNGGKAFIETDVNGDNKFLWYIAGSGVVLKYDLSKDPLTETCLMTGDGQTAGHWYTIPSGLQGGLDGGATYIPGWGALAWQPTGDGETYMKIDVTGTNPVLTAFTPGGDLPNQFHLDGACGLWHPTEQVMYLFTGAELYSFDPVTEEFTNRTPSRAGSDLSIFPMYDVASGSSKAIMGYLPEENLLAFAGTENDDVIIYDPGSQITLTASGSITIGAPVAAGQITLTLTPEEITALGSVIIGSPSVFGSITIEGAGGTPGLVGRPVFIAASQAALATLIPVSDELAPIALGPVDPVLTDWNETSWNSHSLQSGYAKPTWAAFKAEYDKEFVQAQVDYEYKVRVVEGFLSTAEGLTLKSLSEVITAIQGAGLPGLNKALLLKQAVQNVEASDLNISLKQAAIEESTDPRAEVDPTTGWPV